MLICLQIRNFALIDELELDFGPGLTVLTGETGAGKSILVGALGTGLGDRGDVDRIRQGQERADVSLEFTSDGGVADWLQKRDLITDNTGILLRRVVSRDGRSRAYINGTNVTVQDLRGLGEALIEIHGQHEHYSLLRKSVQRELLDEYAGLTDASRHVSTLFAEYQRVQQSITELNSQVNDLGARRDLIHYQIEELDQLALEADEWTELDNEFHRLTHAGELINDVDALINTLTDEGHLAEQVDKLRVDALRLAKLDAKLQTLPPMFDQAVIQLREAAAELRRYHSALSVDDVRLEWVTKRTEAIHRLARKHRVPPQDLPAVHTQLRNQLAHSEDRDQQLARLLQSRDDLMNRYRESALALSAARRKHAPALGTAITAVLKTLGMPDGRILVRIDQLGDGQPTSFGDDDVTFMVAANPDQDPRPLAKIASGGELSRISLAIEVILAQHLSPRTLIFDEVDTGIGGGVAEIVGLQLRALSEKHQVLCVTHSPQIAALAHSHMKISKSRERDTTRTLVKTLTAEERQDELARMLGGQTITAETRAHAVDLLARGQKRRASAHAKPLN